MDRVTSAEQIQVFEEVGRGAFGVVFRGVISASMQEVAIKQIDLEHESADFQEVYREIQILSECQSPQITKYLGCFVKNHKLWVIMEFVDGGTVYEMLKAGPITEEETVATLAYEVVEALDYLHGQRKIHRDLKSANILVSQAGAVKLTDFGVSTQLQSHFSRRNTTVGTPYWMAPEIINNTAQGHGFEADVWSLGCCIYEFFTGSPPLQHQYSPMQALRRISAVNTTAEFFELISLASLGLSPAAEDFLRQCFAVSAKSRPAPQALMKHPFLQLRAMGEARGRCLKELIARKQRWDADNYSVQSKKYYTPTQTPGQGVQSHDSIRFDISTIRGELDDIGPDTRAPKSAGKETVRKSISSGSSRRSTGTEELGRRSNGTEELGRRSTGTEELGRRSNGTEELGRRSNGTEELGRRSNGTEELGTGRKKAWRAEFRRILAKVVGKIERKSALSPAQHRQLTALNEGLMDVFCSVQAGDANGPSRILALQYLRYMMREVRNSEVRGLHKAMVPWDHESMSDAGEGSDPERSGSSAMDEIERSLLASWLDCMQDGVSRARSVG